MNMDELKFRVVQGLPVFYLLKREDPFLSEAGRG